MTTPIAELTQNYPLAFEVIWVGLSMLSFVFMALTATPWHEKDRMVASATCAFVSLWCLGMSILVLLASV